MGRGPWRFEFRDWSGHPGLCARNQREALTSVALGSGLSGGGVKAGLSVCEDRTLGGCPLLAGLHPAMPPGGSPGLGADTDPQDGCGFRATCSWAAEGTGSGEAGGERGQRCLEWSEAWKAGHCPLAPPWLSPAASLSASFSSGCCSVLAGVPSMPRGVGRAGSGIGEEGLAGGSGGAQEGLVPWVRSRWPLPRV